MPMQTNPAALSPTADAQALMNNALRTEADPPLPTSHGIESTMGEMTLDVTATEQSASDSFSKRSVAASGPRAPKQSVTQRRQSLEADRWTLVVEPHRVKCAGCFKWLKLHPKTTYAASNWTRHRQECAQITGSTVVRAGRPKTKADTIVRETHLALLLLGCPLIFH